VAAFHHDAEAFDLEIGRHLSERTAREQLEGSLRAVIGVA
jgi:hypothetical protein